MAQCARESVCPLQKGDWFVEERGEHSDRVTERVMCQEEHMCGGEHIGDVVHVTVPG